MSAKREHMVMALYADGTSKVYNSISECSKAEGLSSTYIIKTCQNPNRSYRSKNYHPTRFKYVEPEKTKEDMNKTTDEEVMVAIKEYHYSLLTKRSASPSQICDMHHIDKGLARYFACIVQDGITMDNIRKYRGILREDEERKRKVAEADAGKPAVTPNNQMGDLLSLLRSIDSRLASIAKALS